MSTFSSTLKLSAGMRYFGPTPARNKALFRSSHSDIARRMLLKHLHGRPSHTSAAKTGTKILRYGVQEVHDTRVNIDIRVDA